MAETASPNPNLRRRLSTQDASFLYGESRNGPLHIGSIAIFEGELSFDTLLRHFQERIHLMPRYRQRLGFVPLNLAHATLENDPGFRIQNHLKYHRIAPPATLEDMTRAAIKIFERPVDFRKPLWELHALSGVPGITGLLSKIHHSLVDGVSGVELTTVMYDFRPDAPPPAAPLNKRWDPPAPPGGTMLATEALRENASSMLSSLRQLPGLLGSGSSSLRGVLSALQSTLVSLTGDIVATPWNRAPVTQRRKFAWSKYPFADFRAIRSALGGTVNDVVLTMLSEGAARYLRKHGCEASGKRIRIGCPVNVRNDSEKGALGNRVSMMFPSLPAEPIDPVTRLQAVRVETERIKESRAPHSLEAIMGLADLVPPALIGVLSTLARAGLDIGGLLSQFGPSIGLQRLLNFPSFGINFIATNVPGVQVPQYLAGHKCLDQIGMIPLTATYGYGVAILSYNQNLYFGMMAEPNLMPDVEVMKHYVDQTFSELLQAGAQPFASATQAVTAAAD